MYFEVGTKELDKSFGYIIAKHPDNIFSRELGALRKISGKYTTDKTRFVGIVINDPLGFLELSREMNMSNYVHAQLSAVCPFNLEGFFDTFRSSIAGKFKDLTEEEFFRPRDMIAIVGPYPQVEEKIVETFQSFGIKATKVPDEKTELAFLYQFEATSSVTEFLQKIYLISYYLTMHLELKKYSDEKVEKFSRMCTNWLNQSTDRSLKEKLVKKLCKYHTGMIEKFEEGLTKDEDDEVVSPKEKSLHEQRHDLIVKKLVDLGVVYTSIIDWGVGEGKLLKKLSDTFPDSKMMGVDADQRKIEKLQAKSRKRIKLYTQNILYPHLEREQLKPSVLVHSEVIEHMDENDRKRDLKIMRDIIQPGVLVITTPNFEYNVNFEGMEPGTYRHGGHKIEYTLSQFVAEVTDYLAEYYTVQFVNIIPEQPVDKQPSFIIVCTRKTNEDGIVIDSFDKGFYIKLNALYQSFYLDVSGYELRDNEIENGYASRQYQMNGKNIFYLAPTVPPVEWNPAYPDYLEHLESAFDYYRQRGIKDVVCEHKYMGSRAYVLVFKDPEKASRFGYSKITINSRNGYPFFENNDPVLEEIYKEIQSKMEDEFLMMDCEILPWSIKGKGLIMGEFQMPGECAYLLRKMGNLDNLKNAEVFLDVLKNYSQEHPVRIHIFQILAKGGIKEQRNGSLTFCDWINGFMLNHNEKHLMINALTGEYFKSTKYCTVNLKNHEDTLYANMSWDKYCSEGGEGFVVKPMNFINYAKNGYYVQPMLKVRGKRYLKLIYGMDFEEPDYFEKVKHRNVKRKRNLAIQQFELSMKIVRTFLQGNHDKLRTYVGGFIGMENFITKNIDATL